MKSILEFVNQKHITFPKDEHKTILKGLETKNYFYTIRVDKEYNKYHIGDILNSDIGVKLKVLDVKNIKDIKEYQFYEYLTPSMIEYLTQFKKLNVIKLEKL